MEDVRLKEVSVFKFHVFTDVIQKWKAELGIFCERWLLLSHIITLWTNT